MRNDVIVKLRRMSEEEFGHRAEIMWRHLFEKADLAYVPLHKIDDGGAPQLRRRGNNLILPDFEVTSFRFAFYIDAKAKRHPVPYRNRDNELRHGVYENNWLHYRTFSEWNRKHCCLAIFEAFRDIHNEEWSGTFLLQSLAALGEPSHGFSTMADTVFWPRRRFKEIGSFTPEQVAAIWNNHPSMPDIKESLWEALDLLSRKPVQGSFF